MNVIWPVSSTYMTDMNLFEHMRHLQNNKKQPSSGDCAKHKLLNMINIHFWLISHNKRCLIISAMIFLDDNTLLEPLIYFSFHFSTMPLLKERLFHKPLLSSFSAMVFHTVVFLHLTQPCAGNLHPTRHIYQRTEFALPLQFDWDHHEAEIVNSCYWMYQSNV